MSSNNSSNSPKGFVHYFRAGIRFSERLIKNIFIQIKWIFKASRNLHRKLLSLHTTPHQSLPFVYGLVVALVMMILIIPVFMWALIKSI